MDTTATDAGTGTPPRWRDVLRGTQGRLIVGLLVLETMFALHFLTIATVMPAVLDDLGNLELYGWSFIAGSLAQLAVIPISGAAVDRYGPSSVTIVVGVVYTAGIAVAALAPSMAIVVGGRFLQGLAGGGAYALSLGVVAKALPQQHRARVLALLATTWLLPGLFGPPLGARLAETIGWRYAFALPFPILVACLLLILPSLGTLVRGERGPIPIARPLALLAGGGAFFTALTRPTVATLPVLLAGAAVSVLALRGLVPPGTLRAARGPAAAATGAFLLSTAFVATESFTPLMFTDVRHRSLGEMSLALALTPCTWALGSWWQSRAVERVALGRIVTTATAIVAAGLALTATALIPSVSVLVAYGGWAVIALGMGIAFPTFPLSVMGLAGHGNEARDISPTLLMDMVGVAMGAGLGGASIAIAERAGASLTAGLVGAFAVSGVATLLLFLVAPRIPARAGAPR